MNWDRVERLLGAQTFDYLRQKSVAIVGLGSGGGFIATGLAMSGVSKFILIDPDVMEAHNIVRHVGDQRDIGRPKVEVARDLILQRNADAQVTIIQGMVEDYSDLLDEVDLVISAVDGEGAKYLINEICLDKNKIALYGGVYERGEGGDVVVIYPYSGPCYACWALNLREGYVAPSPNGLGELDYGQVNEHGTLDAEPALWLHVVRVASTQADMALNVLLQNTPAHRILPANTVILANHALEIVEGRTTPPYSAEWVSIQRDPNCLVCGRKAHTESGQSLDAIAAELLNIEDEDENNSLRGESR